MSRIPETYVCQHCDGRGKNPLTAAFKEVCELLDVGPLNAGELGQKLKISTAAALGRLTRLEDLGIVERRYFTKTANWFLVSLTKKRSQKVGA